MPDNTATCQLPPPGWHCTREPGHGGPCPTIANTTLVLDLDAIQARVDATTDGPWEAGDEIDGVYAGRTTVVRAPNGPQWAKRIVTVDQTRQHDARRAEANVAFIAAARTDVPALLAEVDRLQAEVERLQAGFAPGVDVSRDQLLATLDDIRQRVAAGDSLEGYINYLSPEQPGDGRDFNVTAGYRVGNLHGQGGFLHIGKASRD